VPETSGRAQSPIVATAERPAWRARAYSRPVPRLTPSPRGAPRPDAFGRWHNAVMPGRPRHPVTTATTVRSYAPLTHEHLDRLVALATLDHKKFTRPDGRPEYAGLRVAVVLAQGAAQQWVDVDARAADPNGVKDLDV
jgi:hypothetical protein